MILVGVKQLSINVLQSCATSSSLQTYSAGAFAGTGLAMGPANERRRYIYNDVSHWLVTYM